MRRTYLILAGLLISAPILADALAREVPRDLEMELALSALPPHLRARGDRLRDRLFREVRSRA